MTGEMSPAPAGYEPVFADAGFNKYVGPVWRAKDGQDFRFTVRDVHMNGGGALHGGMMMALADIAMGKTVHAALEPEGQRAMTVSLNCDFIGAVKLGETIVTQVQITRRTRSIVFVAATLDVGERRVMTATGLWKILGQGGGG
ncbi:MAG: hotdog fold thioesterase [Alphaproteobacteria bacterium]|nr:hotdog fold thioesterase [Alphaproteobacteria bacterium]